jgi:DNA-binding NarL/FixJ family response regulator
MRRVLIVEDHEIVRDALVSLLRTMKDLQIVGAAAGIHDGLPLLRALKPDIVLADLLLDDGSATELMDCNRREHLRARVVVLTGLRDVFAANEALSAGAMGYILKSQSPADIVAAIDCVAAGQRYVAPRIAALLGPAAAAAGAPRGLECLTRREAEVLRMIAHGYSNGEVARRLNVSLKTIESHRGNMNRKLALRNTVDLVRFAAAHGIGSAPLRLAPATARDAGERTAAVTTDSIARSRAVT